MPSTMADWAGDGRAPGVHPSGGTLLDLLTLEQIELDIYRANWVFVEPRRSMYGGQVAAQALRAAGSTVDPARVPHSVHMYFLRRGNSELPVVFKVDRDRDGRSFSARRVAALQDGEVIFTLSASFHVGAEGWSSEDEPAPSAEPPDDLEPEDLFGLFSLEGRVPSQTYTVYADWPTRFWARVTEPLPDDPLLHACALIYISDISTGALPAPDGSARATASIDHAMWFHRPANANDWSLIDFRQGTTGGGRAWYTGSVFTRDGGLVASLAQEMLFR
jgi:acyl-CoA thioesterase-2